MKYTVSNTIDRPLDLVIQKFKDPAGLPKWMEGLQKVEHQSGTPGKKGAKSQLYFLHKNKEMQLTETILEENLPHSMQFAYESPMGYNEVEISFTQLTETQVRQTNTSRFELKGIMRLLGPLFKGMFKKQSTKYIDAFKNYVEE